MSVDMYLKVDGAVGESKDANHKEWSDLISLDWGASQPGSMTTGGGGGIGKVSFNDLNVVARLDKAAPAIMKYCASGKHIGTVEISVCKAGGTQMEYSKFTLEDVLVTSVSYTAAQDGDALLVNYSFQAGKVKQQYWEQTAQGGKGAENLVAWNIKENREA
ncbi:MULTISPECIES: Hcp family type VI secretion system effector [Pseudomonas]|uniref:Type VI secretion system tube protein Hcp n=1 Tax=Pseudomonas nitroreducens TaxID=46680 RepID=A0A6G6IQX2_PSENT|nr:MULTISPECIES: type VI secretion system tube protein Hcp [Pseudomonas]MBG6287936.1 type VI secretion system tube protein Hcp [Pseudomonas nitroreducens]QIE85596.1 type VI secretion system tube protein Hcp [Pseudomonas nitroreducens]UCL87967.1 type VI secretion system tube protein Hcp [Pseudomonas sp. HS-18]WEX00074.1 type VI secretion system tube protein Hcp [Pseudomonas nitroreducens]